MKTLRYITGALALSYIALMLPSDRQPFQAHASEASKPSACPETEKLAEYRPVSSELSDRLATLIAWHSEVSRQNKSGSSTVQ